MKKNVYVIVDNVADELVTDVFTAGNDNVAIRAFKGFLSSQKELSSCVFRLYKLGILGKESGSIPYLTEESTELVCKGSDVDGRILAMDKEVM